MVKMTKRKLEQRRVGFDNKFKKDIKRAVKKWREDGRDVLGLMWIIGCSAQAKCLKNYLDRYYPDVPYSIKSTDKDYTDINYADSSSWDIHAPIFEVYRKTLKRY